MQEITSYKTTDGRVFEHKSQALKHQATIKTEKQKLIEALENGLPDYCCINSIDTICSYGNHSTVTISFSVKNCDVSTLAHSLNQAYK